MKKTSRNERLVCDWPKLMIAALQLITAIVNAFFNYFSHERQMGPSV
jgi:hypothetical protein